MRAALAIPTADVFSASFPEPDWNEVERRYWRQRLIVALDRRAVVTTFREMTAHAEPAPFEYDENTRCMRNARRAG